jgi:hypothetical protein
MDFKVVEQIRKAPNDSKGRIALVAIQELIKSKIPDKNDRIHLMDGNADNWNELDDFLDNHFVPDDSELGVLLKTAYRLLKYGS